MRIERLVIQDWRNYRRCDLSLHSGLNILIGKNAQGKTNLLESIHFLSTGRSHRTSSQSDLIRWEAPGFFLHATVQKRHVNVSIDFSLARDNQRRLKINGVIEHRLSCLLGVINSVIFDPDDLQLLKGAPALRRRFLDVEISQVSQRYLYALQQYSRVLKQRNQALKNLVTHSERETVDVWDEQLVNYGSRLIAMRQQALFTLQAHAKKNLKDISQGREDLELSYRPFGRKLTLSFQEDTIRHQFWEILQREKPREYLRRQSLVGPHRDDFVCLVNGVDIRSFGSQGQQRSSVLALKLAELEYMREMTGDYPVLLLDDVLSELDESRRQELLSRVDRGVQTLITGTEANLFSGLQDKSALIGEIEDGCLSIVSSNCTREV
ncbi:MAG: DNA replication/repair protein RecF [Bacillota bacterium]|jgi:DNA replication and repair protein RecF